MTTTKQKLGCLMIWVGLCLVPVVGPALSTAWAAYWMFFAPASQE